MTEFNKIQCLVCDSKLEDDADKLIINYNITRGSIGCKCERASIYFNKNEDGTYSKKLLIKY